MWWGLPICRRRRSSSVRRPGERPAAAAAAAAQRRLVIAGGELDQRVQLVEERNRPEPHTKLAGQILRANASTRMWGDWGGYVVQKKSAPKMTLLMSTDRSTRSALTATRHPFTPPHDIRTIPVP